MNFPFSFPKSRFLTKATQTRLAIVSLIMWVGSLSGAGQVEAQDQNWPQFRGPLSNPVSESSELPDRWSANDNVEWSCDIPGRGWSSPVVWNDRVFVTTAISNREDKVAQVGADYSTTYANELAQQGLGQEEIMEKLRERDFEMPEDLSVSYRLYCLDLATGTKLWDKEYYQGQPPGGRHRKNSFASETPTTDGELVYVYLANRGIFAFDFAGHQVWNHDLPNRPIYLDFGTGSSPILVEDRLIVLNDNEEASEILAFDKTSGTQLWRVPRGDFAAGERPIQASGWTTPYLWENSLRKEIVTIGPGKLTSYGLDGTELWSIKGVRPGPAGSPFAIGDRLIVNAGAPAPIYSISPGASGDITPSKEEAETEFIRWKYPRSSAYIPTPLVFEGGLYVLSDNGIFMRLEAETGAESFKKRVKSSGADFTTSPWAYAGKIFLASEQGNVFVFEAGSEFKLLHVNPMGEMIMASPALVGERLLLRTEKRLLSIRKESNS